MLLEQGVAQVPYSMENSEVNSLPEILSPEKVHVLIPPDPEFARYNAAVIRSKQNPGDLLIFLREVRLADVKAGTPDKGNLLVYRSTPEKVERVAQLDLSDSHVSHFEDARAYMSDETEDVFIGLTAIRASDNKPVAATVRGKVVDGDFSVDQRSLTVYLNDEGKNMTPISLDQSLFRSEGSRHSLDVVRNGQDENGQNKLIVQKTIQFPKKSWCEWQIGTQAQILPGGILPIHGVNRFSMGVDPKTGQEVFGYTYSLGLAQLDEDLNVIKITDMPLFTRESFKNILPMGKEMDTNKDVIYCCGYSVEGDTVKFVINIGDLMTVEVSKSMLELRRMLDRSSPVVSEETFDKAAA